MRVVSFPDGSAVPVLGQGTWNMGVNQSPRAMEIASLRLGIDLGMTVIDTAEMYGDGATETFVGEALKGVRESVFLVSKVYPFNAGGQKLVTACEESLRRLRTDRLDLYLLHWKGSIPFGETVRGMEALKDAGKIRQWGVSNFDVAEIKSLQRTGGNNCATNQVLYNVTRRGVEFDLLPALSTLAMPVMAYSPVEQGRLPARGALQVVAARHGITAYQVALAWVLRNANVIAIPKAAEKKHVRENRVAADIKLTAQDLAEIDAAFPPPKRKTSLEML